MSRITRCSPLTETSTGKPVSRASMARPQPGSHPAGFGDGLQVVTVQGELDLATAESLYRRGGAAIRRNARLVLLDLASVSFCDSRGLSAFVRIANDADAAGCRYGLVAPRPLVMKILRITGLDRRLPVFRSVDEAMLALGAVT